ncbi:MULTISPECIES: neuraminidase-like domain-containing protein [unclassified Coleofasciculus]|uniref:Tc toxin subunit A-related protein n=1 Tax=unclassified Coleofasciculus TaxID=2692782 RepID=UPI0018801306|nr:MULTISPECIES: neuraminidase-like domain-containing protein [unclassified Coleofasciculus]MBE9128304.1 peptidoglycan-binding protein [Coleofasciculus sp. LEGE 07081]MBE9149866.1 peptidoglycan-binding protein [Coleofasciculus sp. LEGE 07092]
MELQGRNLSLRMTGEDVTLLQEELRQLGFTIEDRESLFGNSTFLAIQEFQRQQSIEATGVVDEATARLINAAVDALQPKSFIVQGEVVQVDGTPVVGVQVQAIEKGLRRETQLGMTTPDEAGRYKIEYPRPEQGSISLIVRAVDSSGNVLVASPTICKAKPVETVQLVVGGSYRGPSEYTQLSNQLIPILRAEGISATALTEEDINFLTCKYELNPEQVTFYVLDALLATETGIPEAAFYGFFRQGLPTTLPDLLSQDREVLRRSLEDALDKNIIPATLRESLDNILARLQEFSVEYALSESEIPGKFSLGALLEVAGLNQEKRVAFLTRYVAHTGSVEEFWSRLREDSEFNQNGAVEQLQFTLQLGILTNNYLPLVGALKAKPEVNNLRDLARFDVADWLELINNQQIGTSPDISGENQTEKAENYAKAMVGMMETTLPTAVFASRLAKDNDSPFANRADLNRFFANNQDFELSTPVERYLAAHPEALRGIEDEQGVRKELKTTERLFRIAPEVNRYPAVRALRRSGITSAKAIREMGRSAFVRNYAEQIGGTEAALTLYHNASQTAATALALFADYSAAMNNISLNVIDSIAYQPSQKLPNWKTLFGSADFCACEHCCSIYSPAAYLVDSLQFLAGVSVKGGKTALNELFTKRRGDIGNIKLSCQNTNTPLPYIDLVNEILENAIEPTNKVYQTEGTAEELRAMPEHLNINAYQILKQQKYPWNLPFHLWNEEARVYLEHLGIKRSDLMKRFYRGDSEVLRPSIYDIAMVALGLTELEWNIIIGADPDFDNEPQNLWGMSNEDVGEASNWVQALKHAPKFLEKSGLSYQELRELLLTSFINPRTVQFPEGVIRIEFSGQECDLDKASIINLSQETALKIVRFVRLQRKLGWSIPDLDRAIKALNGENLNPNFLVQLFHIKQLQSDLKVPLSHLLSWWGTKLDTRTYKLDDEVINKSPYAEVFLNKAFFTTPEDMEPFELNELSTELKATPNNITEYIAPIAAALGISNEDFYSLSPTITNQLNLANISGLYRVVSLAKSLHLSIREYLTFWYLIGGIPFQSPQETMRFVEEVRFVRESAFSLSELTYLLWHIETPAVGVAPKTDSITLILNALQDGLKTISAETTLTPDPTGELTRANLAKLPLEGEEAEKAMTLQKAMKLIQGNQPLPNDAEAFINEQFGAFPEVAQAMVQLIGNNAPTEPEQRFSSVLQPLLNYLRRYLSQNFIIRALAEALNLEVRATELLLTQLVIVPIVPNQKAIAFFLNQDFIDDTLTAEAVKAFEEAVKTFTLLWKIALILNKLAITPVMLPWLFESGSELLINLNALSFENTGVSLVSFSQLKKLLRLIKMRDALRLDNPSLLKLLNAENRQTFAQVLSELTGWSESDLRLLAKHPDDFPNEPTQNVGLISLSFPEDYRNGEALTRFQACLEMSKRLGVSAQEIFKWLTPDLTAKAARSIRLAVQAKYGFDQWLKVASSLRDKLRLQQRNALVSYLVGGNAQTNAKFKDTNDLFAHYLIDVEMAPCMLTSRIKQAISSVQLFIQRCLMNLEPDVTMTTDDADKWTSWKKWYRVWEANRKVFLYPENWIEPELRDNKSPFFKDLESELLQNEVTLETVEEAFRGYLEKLDEVARLEISGMYYQEEILHVFGRTRGIPHIYYYRRWENSAFWTAWERVDLDIEGEHLIPVVWNQRLYLFWPIFTEKANEPTKLEKEGSKPSKYWEIQLAWSEYKNGKWSAKKISVNNKFVKTYEPQKRFYRFTSRIIKGSLAITVCLTTVTNINAVSLNVFTLIIGEFLLSVGDGTIQAKTISGNFKFPEIVTSRYSYFEYMKLFENQKTQASPDRQLVLISGQVDTNGFALASGTDIPTLKKTPGIFTITFPSQFRDFMTQAPFFYEDDTRTFFVTPHERQLDRTRFNTALPESVGSGILLNFTRKNVEEPTITNSNAITTTAAPLTNVGSNANAALALSLQNPPRNGQLHIARSSLSGKKYLFEMFYHPFVGRIIRHLNLYGLDYTLNPIKTKELYRQEFSTPFFDEYAPTSAVKSPRPVQDFDFLDGAYSLYNWEFFFHAPFLIANHLSQNQRFEEAHRWFHYIFDPTNRSTDVSGTKRFWKIKPFVDNEDATKRIDKLLKLLSEDEDNSKEKRSLVDQIDAWNNNPFNPHLIARMRITAYQKAVVMKYLDNLIAWGDQLFRRDTIESINEAAQLYILAAEILGPRPQSIQAQKREPETYNSLRDRLDDFSNALIEVENTLPPVQDKTSPSKKKTLGINDFAQAGDNKAAPPKPEPPHPLGTILYFCIPKNDKLLSYWDTVADRLFKIRNCMNIEGVVRELPLFEPPIDPALLVKAAAAGIDIGSALNDLNAPLPHYRFQVVLQKAVELCADVKALGAALLSALEKKDAEELSLLRSGHEIKLLDAVRQIKEQQIEEAKATLEGLIQSRVVTETRHQYYASREYTNANEKLHLAKLETAHVLQTIGQGFELAASTAFSIPEFDIGTSGISSPVVKVRFGGSNVGQSLQAHSRFMSSVASLISYQATIASIKGGYDRRQDDWKLQEDLAAKELNQIDKQIIAAAIRLAITERDLKNHDLQVENAKEVDTYMREKFTNQELYNWMVSQISTLYFQSYQLAFDVAKRTEKAYQFELGITNSKFIQPGYWDSLKKGLLAGDKLHYDLKRMEVAYLDQNKREYEITKQISLVLHNPLALISLKEMGVCEVELPEALFDMDYPGHYMRRIKNVSITIPCVTGPYTSINCTLTLLSNKTRIKSTPVDPYVEGEDDDRFVANFGAIQSITTSTAQNDSGMFELNFRDERYLPFEGAGVISRWRLDMPKDCNAFDFDTISDVIIKLNYTAREGGKLLGDKAKDALKGLQQTEGLWRMFSAKHEFPTQWYRFLHPSDEATAQSMRLDLTQERFPFQLRGKSIQFNSIQLFLKLKDTTINPPQSIELFVTKPSADQDELNNQNEITPQNDPTDKVTLERDSTFGNLLHGEMPSSEGFGSRSIKVRKNDMTSIQDAIEDIILVCHYSVTS